MHLQVNSWDTLREADPADTFCSGHISSPWFPDFLFVFLSRCLSSLPPTIRRITWAGRNEKRYCALLNGRCVCVCFGDWVFSSVQVALVWSEDPEDCVVFFKLHPISHCYFPKEVQSHKRQWQHAHRVVPLESPVQCYVLCRKYTSNSGIGSRLRLGVMFWIRALNYNILSAHIVAK